MNSPRRFAALPPAKYLTPRILELDAEAVALDARRREQVAERARLAHVDMDEQAADDDRKAAAAAIRAGKSAHSVGTPATDKLAEVRKAADAEINALAEAVVAVDAEITAEFDKLAADPKTSGFTAAVAARAKYGKAIADLESARADFHAAAAMHAYVRAAGTESTANIDATAKQGPDGYPVTNPAWLRRRAANTRSHELTWRGGNQPPVSFARYVEHLGIRQSDALLDAKNAVAVFAAELEEH